MYEIQAGRRKSTFRTRSAFTAALRERLQEDVPFKVRVPKTRAAAKDFKRILDRLPTYNIVVDGSKLAGTPADYTIATALGAGGGVVEGTIFGGMLWSAMAAGAATYKLSVGADVAVPGVGSMVALGAAIGAAFGATAGAAAVTWRWTLRVSSKSGLSLEDQLELVFVPKRSKR